MKSTCGVTLIELMVAVALAAILLTVALPSYQTVIENNSLSANLNRLVSSLNFARSEGVKRGKRVSLCKSDDGNDCGGAGYEAGWIVFVEEATSSDGVRQVGTEDLIRVQDGLKAGYTLRGNNNFANFISFLPSGEATNMGRFVLCKDSDLKKSRAIFIIRTGRVRLASDNDGNLIPEDEDGVNITTCTP
jgi:type IV fimbrial biogenesis protein FimT